MAADIIHHGHVNIIKEGASKKSAPDPLICKKLAIYEPPHLCHGWNPQSSLAPSIQERFDDLYTLNILPHTEFVLSYASSEQSCIIHPNQTRSRIVPVNLVCALLQLGS